MPPTALRIVRNRPAPRVDPEFQKLIAPLMSEERRQLEANLAAEGCRDALAVWNGTLLDGHNRLEICTRLRIPYRTCELDLPSREAAKLWIEENQIGRRNLTPDQRAAIAYRILQRRITISKRDRARKGGLAGGAGRGKVISLVAPASTKQERTRERVARENGVSTKALRAITELAKQDPNIVGRVANGEVSIKRARHQLHNKTIHERYEAAKVSHPTGQGIYTGGFEKLNRILKNGEVDLFLTDPPWTGNGLAAFTELAALAEAKLKPGGLCVVDSGSYFVPEVISRMSEHLQFYWLCGIKLNGAHTRVWPKKLFQGFRPILLFAKPPMQKVKHEWFIDLIDGTSGDKAHHKWGKATTELEHLIERLTEPNDLVVDPFVGGGSVPVACKALKRRFIGTEIDAGVAAAARARIAKVRS
jgi:hypothetical protein